MALTAGPHHLATMTADLDRLIGPLLSAGFHDPDGLWGEVCWDLPPSRARGAGERSDWNVILYPDRS